MTRKNYVPSSEALERRKERDRVRSRAKRAKQKKAVIFVLQKSDLPCHKITARRMMPRLPAGTTKADLREMLAQAAANTASK